MNKLTTLIMLCVLAISSQGLTAIQSDKSDNGEKKHKKNQKIISPQAIQHVQLQKSKANQSDKDTKKTNQRKNQSNQLKEFKNTSQLRTIKAEKAKPVLQRIDLAKLKGFKRDTFTKQNKKSVLKTYEDGLREADNSSMSTVNKTKDGEFCAVTTLKTNFTTKDFKDFTVNGPPDWLKPGIILDAVSFVRGANRIEEQYERGPITLALPGSGKAVTIDNPQRKSDISMAISDLISDDPDKKHGANISYSYTEIQSAEQLNLKVNGRYSNSFYGIAAKLGVSNKSQKSEHYYLVEFMQTLFSIEVDGLNKTEIFPNNANVDLSDYVYISKVNYGRKGYFMFKTQKSLEDFGVSADVSASYAGHNAAIKSNLQKITSNKSTEVEAFYYGGSIDSAAKDLVADWEAKGRKPLEDYINGYHFSEAESYPISYELKNLDNEQVGMNSQNVQTIETCVPNKGLMLKVTLLELQCDVSGDSDRIGDFGITQHILYKANGEIIKPVEKHINKFPNNTNCDPGGINRPWQGSTALICGNKNRQIHEAESKKPLRRNPNINNSIVFNITPAQANDKNAEFIIDTWVKEYSNNDVVMNKDPRKLKVAIHDVLASLQGIRTVDNKDSYFDGGVNHKLKFDHFDGIALPLRDVGYAGKTILEGPIRARNKGKDLNQKAFVWMRFQLID